MNTKLYHFYKDEGGMFGACRICISEKKLRIVDEIAYYYMGKMPMESIVNVVALFKKAYPKCSMLVHKKSIDFDIANELKKYYSGM